MQKVSLRKYGIIAYKSPLREQKRKDFDREKKHREKGAYIHTAIAL